MHKRGEIYKIFGGVGGKEGRKDKKIIPDGFRIEPLIPDGTRLTVGSRSGGPLDGRDGHSDHCEWWPSSVSKTKMKGEE